METRTILGILMSSSLHIKYYLISSLGVLNYRYQVFNNFIPTFRIECGLKFHFFLEAFTHLAPCSKKKKKMYKKVKS